MTLFNHHSSSSLQSFFQKAVERHGSAGTSRPNMKTENKRRDSSGVRRTSAPLVDRPRREPRVGERPSRTPLGDADYEIDAFWIGFVRLVVFGAVFATMIWLLTRA